MNDRVLTDLELRKVEPEGLHLPDEPLEVAVPSPRSASLHERLLDDDQVRFGLCCVGIRQVRVTEPGRRDPLGDDEQHLTVRLVGRLSAMRAVSGSERTR